MRDHEPFGTPINADNSSGSLLVVCNDWRLGARRFHVGQSHSELIKQAGYTTAGYFLRVTKTINRLLLFEGSPCTTSYATLGQLI
jgi:hypothetical protein